MSISQNFPDEGPSLNLNFASSRILDPRITFTRTSTGTYLSNNGLVTIAPTDTPRFDHSYNGSNVESLGLLIEESRTNLITYSEQFDNAAWTKTNAGITTNTSATTAPDGSNNAEKLVENTSNSTHLVYAGSSALTAGQSYVISVYVKAAERTFASIGSVTSGSGTGIDLSTGALVNVNVPGWTTASTRSVINIGNGWYRVTVTVSSATGNNSLFDSIRIFTNNGTTTNYTGDGTSGIYIWGAQLEAGAFPTSYIPTVASTVTRSADNASMTGTNFSSWYNSTEGTLFASIRNQTVRSSITYDRFIALCGSDVNLDEISIYTQTASGAAAQNKFNFSIVSGGTPSADFNVAGPDNIGKAILAYKTNDAAGTVNGITPGTDTSVTLPTCVSLQICSAVRYQQKPTATISQLLYYPRRLTNTQLQNLTK